MTDYEDTKLTDCAILNFWWTSNYGAILTAYALQQVLNDIGITSQLVNYQYGYKKKLYKNSLFEDFANKYLITSKKISNKKDFEILGKSVKTFIVGSDQVFNTYMTRNRLNEYLRGFADMFSKRIALSASFGVEDLQISDELKYRYKNYLKMFDYITLREFSGIDICKNHFDCDASWLIDPVFIADKENYENICKTATLNCTDKILTYVLDENQNYKNKYNEISKKLNKEIISITKNNVNVEDWLNAIRTCEYMITDSFHGVCFAIIFNKPFICISNAERGSARFKSLFEALKIPTTFLFNHINDVNLQDDIFNNIDYNQINNVCHAIKQDAYKKIELMVKSPKTISNDALAAQLNILRNNNFKQKIKNKNFMPISVIKTENNFIMNFFGIKLSIKRK